MTFIQLLHLLWVFQLRIVDERAQLDRVRAIQINYFYWILGGFWSIFELLKGFPPYFNMIVHAQPIFGAERGAWGHLLVAEAVGEADRDHAVHL